MAPEIYKHKYRGEQTDVFALGVILFMIYSGRAPFVNSKEDEKYYSKIHHKEKYHLFWMAHENDVSQPKVYFSDNFKKLFI